MDNRYECGCERGGHCTKTTICAVQCAIEDTEESLRDEIDQLKATIKQFQYPPEHRISEMTAEIEQWRSSSEAFAIRVLGQEAYDTSPCQANPLELIEHYITELRESTKDTIRDASCLDAGCDIEGKEPHKPHCDHAESEQKCDHPGATTKYRGGIIECVYCGEILSEQDSRPGFRPGLGKCFWKTGCANSERCREAKMCIADWQNANKDKLFETEKGNDWMGREKLEEIEARYYSWKNLSDQQNEDFEWLIKTLRSEVNGSSNDKSERG